jgi:hypothetical protein
MNILVRATVLSFLLLHACSAAAPATGDPADAGDEGTDLPPRDRPPAGTGTGNRDAKIQSTEPDTAAASLEDAAPIADTAAEDGAAERAASGTNTDADPEVGPGNTIAASLSATRLEIACPGATFVTRELCTGPRERKTSRTFGGDLAKTYDVNIRIRGLVEGHLYLDENGKRITTVTAAPFFGKNVTPDPVGGENAVLAIFRLDVSEPKATHYLNVFSNINTGHRTYPIDYTATVRVKGGAAVDLIYKDGNTEFVANFKKQVVPGVAPAPAPFNGMFVQLDAVSAAQAR